MNKPLVSIIMPVKNGGEYFRPCLESFLAQPQHDFCLELVVVDDHSTDGSDEIARDYARNNAQITFIRNSGTGILDALNTGLSVAQGDFISRMDADDIMPEGKFVHLKSSLDSREHAMATGRVGYFASGKELGEGYVRYQNWLNDLCEGGTHYQQIYTECPVASPNWLIRRKDFEAIGGFGDIYPEDYDLIFRCREAGLEIVAAEEITHLWRDHQHRASRNDAHYSDNSFLELKCRWFEKADLDATKTLVLVGAGKKGKRIATYFEENGVPFTWLTNNKRKIGVQIGQSKPDDYGLWIFDGDQQVIGAIAAPDDKAELARKMSTLGLKQGQGYFPFC